MTRAHGRMTARLAGGIPALLLVFPPAAPPLPAQGTPAAGGWVRRSDPSGLSVEVPAGWTVAMDARTGRTTVTGPRGQQVHLWPGFIQGRNLDPASAQAVLAQVSRTLDAALPWGRPTVQGNTARSEARTAKRNGVALLSWRPSGGGTALLAQAAEAPPAVYPSSLETFGRILESFRYEPAAAPPAAKAQAPTAGPGGFTRWTDPKEGAFSVEVPQGWNATGGLYRLSATDVRPSLRLLSPDHQIYIFVNDARLGGFIEPSPMLAQFGFREGSLYQLPDGARLPVRRFQPGQPFASAYAPSMVPKGFTGLRVTAGHDRPDLATAYDQQLRAESVGTYNVAYTVTAGDAAFTCNGPGGGAPWSGYLSAGTVVVNGQSRLWFVHRIIGYLAAPGRQAEAEGLCRRVAQTYATSPAWRQKEAQLCAQAVQQDNLRSQRLRSQVLARIAEDQRATTDLIVSGYNKRSATMDEISRRRENATLGTVDVVDPRTGDQYKVNYDSDAHWMTDTGRVVGTTAGANPGPGWTRMLALP